MQRETQPVMRAPAGRPTQVRVIKEADPLELRARRPTVKATIRGRFRIAEELNRYHPTP